jgi:hypothetical protein
MKKTWWWVVENYFSFIASWELQISQFGDECYESSYFNGPLTYGKTTPNNSKV